MTVSLAVPDVLVARAQAGDEAALEALYRAFEAPVYNLVRRMLRRPEDAEDVLQETFLEVVRRSEEHTSELQSRPHLVCRLLLEKKKMRFRFLVWDLGVVTCALGTGMCSHSDLVVTSSPP